MREGEGMIFLSNIKINVNYYFLENNRQGSHMQKVVRNLVVSLGLLL